MYMTRKAGDVKKLNEKGNVENTDRARTAEHERHSEHDRAKTTERACQSENDGAWTTERVTKTKRQRQSDNVIDEKNVKDNDKDNVKHNRPVELQEENFWVKFAIKIQQ